MYKTIVNFCMLLILVLIVLITTDYVIEQDMNIHYVIIYGQLTVVFGYLWGKLASFLMNIE